MTNLFRVLVTQQEVGGFDICMDILIFMDILQDIHLTEYVHAKKKKKKSVKIGQNTCQRYVLFMVMSYLLK